MATPSQSTESISSEGYSNDNIIPFNEATVLNAIFKVTNDYELGICLGLDDFTLKEIEKYPVHDRKRMLVAQLFAVKPENCNWTKVNAAINGMKVSEWNDRMSVTSATSKMSTTSITTTYRCLKRKKSYSLSSDEVFLKRHKSEESSAGSSNNFTESFKHELKLINKACIMEKYSSLQERIALQLKHVDIDELKFHIETYFKDEDISDIIAPAENPLEIFNLLNTHHLWYYGNIYHLSSTAQEFIKSQDIQEYIDDYNKYLVGFVANTTILEKIKYDTLCDDKFSAHQGQDSGHCDRIVRKKLVVKLLQDTEDGVVNISEYTLKYIEEVFERLKKEFNITLDAVLHKVALGCVEVTWYIPSLSAQLIINKLPQNIEFLRKMRVSKVFLEDIQIYSENKGVANFEDLNTLRLLLAVQDKNIERVKDFIEEFSMPLNENKDRQTLMSIATQRARNGDKTKVTASLPMLDNKIARCISNV